MSDLKSRFSETATAPGKEATNSAEAIQDRAKEAWTNVQDCTGRAVRESSAYVRQNPLPVAAAAFGVGLLAGVLLAYRRPETFSERYLDEPLHRSRGMLLGLTAAMAAVLKRSYGSASEAAEELASDIGEGLKERFEPLAKAAQRNGKKFGL